MSESTAENSVIDNRIKEIVRDLLLKEDIVNFDKAEFEVRLHKKVNELLSSKGVALAFLSMVVIPDEQTREAIDVVSAYRIYEPKGFKEAGQDVVKARAGATKIILNLDPQTGKLTE